MNGLACRLLAKGERTRRGSAARRGMVAALVMGALLATGVSPVVRADDPAAVTVANYRLASQWTPAKVGKLVFDTSLTPHWLEFSDRFWYSFETTAGKRYMLVDPMKRTKAPLFDHVKLAARITAITQVPVDAQHLGIKNLRFIKKDTAIRIEVEVPKDAVVPGLKTPEPPAKDKTRETTEGAANGQTNGQTNGDQRTNGDQTTGEQKTGEQKTGEQKTGEQQKQTTRTRTTTGERTGGDSDNDENGSGSKKSVYLEHDLTTGQTSLLGDFEGEPKTPRWASVSPDDQIAIFARGTNLFMMDAANYAKARKDPGDDAVVETPVTTDGEPKFSYARRIRDDDKSALRKEQRGDTKHKMGPRVPPIVITWSKDSKKFAVVRRDERKVSELWVINALTNPRPTLESYSYAMPGEKNIAQPVLEVFDVASKARTPVKAERFADQSISIVTGPATAVNREKEKLEPQWIGAGSDTLYFTRASRDLHKQDVLKVDLATSAVTVLVEERLNTYIETKPIWLIGNGRELVQWSERDGWGHFYLYDGSGTLKNQITSGEFVGVEIEAVDEKTRTMFFTAVGREKGEDPYYPHLYRVGLDGTGLKMLTPGDASHSIAANDAGTFFVDNASRVNTPVVSTLHDAQGAPVVELETTDMSRLEEAGYKFPEPFKVKADDGVTDLYGVMYKPYDFDPAKKYPVVAYVYPGPQTESVTKTFSPKHANNGLAQFGFIVIEVGNRGGHPQRSKWYHNYGYGNLRDYGLADKKSALEQLARKHSYIDLDRVGINGHSGGGFMSAAAMFVYPDFFKVAVSESGNHDNNIYNNTWSEKHHGIKEVEKDGEVSFEYSIDKNSELAKNLKGRLLLVTGDIDDNVHPSGTYRVANALIKANKRFDFFIFPGVRHSFQPVADYFFWLRADYFCRYLLGDAAYQGVDIPELNREKEQNGRTR